MRLALVLWLLPSVAIAMDAEHEIRASFARLQAALRAHDTDAAVRELDDDVVRRCEALRSAALVAPDLHALDINDQILVLRFRVSLGVERLSAMDGRALLAFATDKGWLPPLPGGALSRVKVEGTLASVELRPTRPTTKTRIVYRKGARGWRLDLSARPPLASAWFELARAPGESDAAMVKRLVEEGTGQPLTEAAWRPLVTVPPR